MKSIFAPNRSKRKVNPPSPGGMTRPSRLVANGFARLKLSLELDWAQREIRHRDGRRNQLSARETALLACLARKAGNPVSRDEILSQVWQLDPRRTATRTIDMHISLLRRKLDDDADRPMILITVHGVGYMLHCDTISYKGMPPSADESSRVALELKTEIESLSVA